VTPSLRIGSDALGWQEFGDAAQLGVLTRAMPGGDGSLDFTIPGDVADRRRNILRPAAECVLDLPGAPWAGLIVGDPMAGFYSARAAVPVAAAGLWAQAAARRDVAWVWTDSDPTQWQRIRSEYNVSDDDLFVGFPDQGKFDVDTEGRLLIKANPDLTYSAHSRACLAYWLGGGLVDFGNRIYGIDLSYKSVATGDWRVLMRAGEGSPWETVFDGNKEIDDSADHTTWYSLPTDLTEPSTSACLQLNWNNAGTSTPGTARRLYARTVIVYCRMDGASVDRDVTLDKAMCDLAQMAGLATVVRSETLGTARTDLALRPDAERSVVDGLRELASLHANALEYYFDRVAGAWRFTLNETPETVNPARNRHWIIDDKRGGESSEGVVRDYEAAPDYVRVSYLSTGVTGVPDGRPRTYCYPSEPTDFRAHVAVDTAHADAKLTAAQAQTIAARIYTQRTAVAFAGPATFGPLALTISGQELPSYLMLPGDRLTIPGRVGASNLYIRGTSYDFRSATMTADVGWPFDVLPVAGRLPSNVPTRKPDGGGPATGGWSI